LRTGQRFGHVIIGSGDGIFAEVVDELTAGNTKVTVVSRRRSLSQSLVRSAAELIVYEDLPFNTELVAA
jgi:NAD(P)-dependent dehydrogenase (short-subunit alcohol dehydrogenase family)